MNLDNMKTQAEENPLAAVAVVALVVTAATKLLNAISANRNSKAWSREVKRRVKSGK